MVAPTTPSTRTEKSEKSKKSRKGKKAAGKDHVKAEPPAKEEKRSREPSAVAVPKKKGTAKSKKAKKN